MKKCILRTWIAGILITSATCNPVWAGDITKYVIRFGLVILQSM